MRLPQVYNTPASGIAAALRGCNRSLSRLGHWLAPPRCLLCGSGDCSSALDLCRQCTLDLPVTADSAAGMPPWPAVFSPWRYEYPVDRLIRALKFHGDRSVARTLGGLLADTRAARPEPLPDLLVPVPLHIGRLRQRGYNQADEIARAVAGVLDIQRLPLALERVRETAAQSGLPAALRPANVAGAFRLSARLQASLSGARIALIDDVVTTGSTARAAAQALLDADAKSVELWALARVTHDDT